MYVLDTATDEWEEIGRHLTVDADGDRSSALGASVPVADHVADGEITVLVQHSEGFAGAGAAGAGHR